MGVRAGWRSSNIPHRHLIIGKMPSRELEPLPPKPHDIDENEEARKQWRRQASEVHARNRRTNGRRAAVSQRLWLADRFKDEPEIFFPHSLDWRGRAYPLPAVLSPQGDDTSKGLLRFAEGRPLGQTGAWWLKVHIANLAGVDKCSFGDRVRWVHDNEDVILDSGVNPLGGSMWWAKQENPWQMLAACFEYVGYALEGDSYVSHLPIAVDGSCSGLQHFSAMLRDRQGGEAVNLVPMAEPQDIYQRLADRVADRVVEDAEAEAEDDELKLASRSVCLGLTAAGMTSRGLRSRQSR